MHDEHVARGQIGKEIFGAAAEAGHRLAFQPLGEILRQRPAQIAAAHFDLDEALALHGGLEPAAYGFDFRKFRHC